MFFKKSLENRVEKAKKDDNELNSLIKEYKPFIASVAQKKTGRFLNYGLDDELSIGMMAFKEAVESYDENKGKFLSFAKMVINSRLIDYYRKTDKQRKEVYINETEKEDCIVKEIGQSKAISKYKSKEENEIRKFEIMEYKKELDSWGIEFSDLVKVSPKQQRLRNIYIDVAKIIFEDKDILESLISSKRLPIKKIKKKTDIHRKKLERGRIYIIALVVVFMGDYEYIRDYINGR